MEVSMPRCLTVLCDALHGCWKCPWMLRCWAVRCDARHGCWKYTCHRAEQCSTMLCMDAGSVHATERISALRCSAWMLEIIMQDSTLLWIADAQYKLSESSYYRLLDLCYCRCTLMVVASCIQVCI